MKKAQLSIEALIALAAFLSAISLLIFSAGRMGGGLRQLSQESSERHSLAYEALASDTAAGSLAGSRIQHSWSGSPSQDGARLVSNQSPSVSCPLFHRVSASQSGGFYVQGGPYEPV